MHVIGCNPASGPLHGRGKRCVCVWGGVQRTVRQASPAAIDRSIRGVDHMSSSSSHGGRIWAGGGRLACALRHRVHVRRFVLVVHRHIHEVVGVRTTWDYCLVVGSAAEALHALCCNGKGRLHGLTCNAAATGWYSVPSDCFVMMGRLQQHSVACRLHTNRQTRSAQHPYDMHGGAN